MLDWGILQRDINLQNYIIFTPLNKISKSSAKLWKSYLKHTGLQSAQSLKKTLIRVKDIILQAACVLGIDGLSIDFLRFEISCNLKIF